MTPISMTELRTHTGAIVRRLREGESFLITRYGEPVAVLRPIRPWERASQALQPAEEKSFEQIWQERDRLAAEISKHWTGEPDAVAAVREQRRNLTPDEWVMPDWRPEDE